MRNGKLFVAIVLALPVVLARAEADANSIKVSGYLKSILGRSTTFIGPEQDYSVSQNRLRMQLQGTLAPELAIDLQYDNEVMLGSYLDTAHFQWQKQLPSAQYWKAGTDYADKSDIHGRHRFYRASFTFSHGNTDIRFGRQRIAWGTGRFWSPLDILNPISPIQLERDERPGVDAMLVEHKLGPLSRVSVVYAPQHDRRNASVAAQFHGNDDRVDYSIVWGKFQQDHTLGLDIATQLGNAGVRSELTYTRPGTGKAYRRALIGIDYAFANTLTLSAEWFYNGRGMADRANYDFNALLAGRVQSLARNYAGFYAGYEITPLLKWNNYLVLNLDDRSHYFSPSVAYSLTENLEWTVGLQQFGGAVRAEYGRMPDFYYTQLKWFF
jgi:hypothetical protein